MDPETNMNQNPQSMNPHRESSVGSTIGVIIVLAIIILGGLYFWSQRDDMGGLYNDDNTAAELQEIESQSNSDDVSSIEADLENTQYENLDAELNAS